MTTTIEPPKPITDFAAQQAAANFAANRSALPEGSLEIVSAAAFELLENLSPTWIFARDGSLTAMLPGEKWWAGCSVPTRSAQYMLKTMDVTGPVACFLTPGHAAQLRVALDRLNHCQAIVAIVPDLLALAMLLHCEDFSADIRAHRLWFAAGTSWQTQLDQLFSRHPGLPTPSQFIRPILADASPADRLIGPAQEVFAEVALQRGQRIASLNAQVPKARCDSPHVCLVGSSRFKLWDDAGAVMAELDFAGTSIQASPLDCDHPLSAAPLALSMAAAECDAMIAANLYRSSLPGVTPDRIAWITWATTPRFAQAKEQSPRDRLILADPNWHGLARAAGWNPQQISIGQWPTLVDSSPPASGRLTIIADTQQLDVPEAVQQYSSHGLLWEYIAEELTSDPFQLGTDIDQYLTERRNRFGVGEAGFDRPVFIENLTLPAFAQGIARLLHRQQIPLRLIGRGWDAIEELRACCGGVVQSRGRLRKAIEDSSGLIHVWPRPYLHPIQSAGRPVAIAFGQSQDAFLRQVQNLQAKTNALSPVISGRLLAKVMQTIPT